MRQQPSTISTFWLCVAILAVALGGVFYLKAKDMHCAAIGGKLEYRSEKRVGPVISRPTGVPKQPLRVSVCVDHKGNKLF